MYGSDAVGGVGNVILQRDYDGVAVGARYGDASEAGLTPRRLGGRRAGGGQTGRRHSLTAGPNRA